MMAEIPQLWIGAVLAVGVFFLFLAWQKRTSNEATGSSTGRAGLPQGSSVPMHIGQKAQRLASQGDLDGALAVYKSFLVSNPDSALALNNAGAICLQMDRNKEAADLFSKALFVDKQYAAAWANRGVAMAKLGYLPDAKRAFERALELEPTNGQAQEHLQAVERWKEQIRSASATHFSDGMGIEFTCESCRRVFTRIRYKRQHLGAGPEYRAIGAVLCCYCGEFKCEQCALETMRRGNCRQLVCACGKAHVALAENDAFHFDGFRELVVFLDP